MLYVIWEMSKWKDEVVGARQSIPVPSFGIVIERKSSRSHPNACEWGVQGFYWFCFRRAAQGTVCLRWLHEFRTRQSNTFIKGMLLPKPCQVLSKKVVHIGHNLTDIPQCPSPVLHTAAHEIGPFLLSWSSSPSRYDRYSLTLSLPGRMGRFLRRLFVFSNSRLRTYFPLTSLTQIKKKVLGNGLSATRSCSSDWVVH